VTTRGALTFVLAAALSGCLPSVRANVSVPELERAFPTITELGLRSYEFRRFNSGEPICEAIDYRRGTFVTINDGLCGNFDGDGGANRLAIDQTATLDLARLKTALAGNEVDFTRQILIEPNVDGSVGPGSYFSNDGCVTYFYSPGWTALPSQDPGEEVSKGINPNWYQTDICP
jgi:hypothetical protein